MSPQSARQTLGMNVIPTHYTLQFEPDFRTFRFKGKATINVEVKKPARIIKINARELKITNVLCNKLPGSIHQDDQRQELTFTFPQTIQGKAQLEIEFSGYHNEKMYGFYRSKYTLNGKDTYLLTTQFEAANARTAFPCFDEPALKATFDVTLVVDKSMTPLSNMPVREEKALNNKKQVTFQRTPRMSTYLLYMGVGNFKSLMTKHRNIDLRIFTMPDKLHLARLPLHFTRTFLKFLEDYFKIPYPLPKLDIIAIPDFAAGAMENWGAITFREIALLGDDHTSVAVKQQIAITIAHELAHQWFGNLVTMGWWEDLWLNESFATFMSYKTVNAAYPDWDLPLQYYSDTIADALNADQLDSTHPINVDVKTPAQVDEIFDRISYDKGGSILQMLEKYVGEEIFRQGLQRYLKKHAYGNAVKEDLWVAIQQEYGKENLTALMKNWILQPGYPLVKVQRSKQGYVLEQKRFTLLGRNYSQWWLVPVTYQSGKDVKKVLLKENRIILPEQAESIKLNLNQNGFYRVQYPPELLQKIGKDIHGKKLSALDAAGVEDDFYALVAAGEVPVKEYLEFVRNYCLDARYPLDLAVSLHLTSLHRFFFGKPTAQPLAAAIAKVSLLYHQRLLQRLGWNRKKNEKNTDTMLRAVTIVSLGFLNHKETLQQFSLLFQKIRKNQAVDPNLRGAVYALAAWQGDEETYSYFLERYKQEKLPEESRKLLRALGMFKDVALLKKALDLSQSSTVRLQDSLVLPLTISANVYGSSLLWPWTKHNWPQFLKKYSSGTHLLSPLVNNLAGIDTEEVKKDVQQFLSARENFREDITLALKQTVEKIEVNMKFLQRNS